MPGQPQSTEQDSYIWLEIDDFTPGIITKSDYANASQLPVPGSKLGQAQSAVGCIALPNGGLAPLPGFGAVIEPNHNPSGAGSATMTVGLFVFGPLDLPGESLLMDNVIWGQAELAKSGSFPWTFYLEEANAFIFNSKFDAVGSRQTLVTLGPAGAVADTFGFLQFNTMTGGLTVIGPSVPEPCWALSYWYGGVGSNSNYPGQPWQWFYANPNVPGDPPLVFNGSPNSSYPADVLTHQNRTVLLQFTGKLWSTAGAESAYLINNEPISYTDPPGAQTDQGSAELTQQELFNSEHPAGVGAWGSINASELFMVKNSGGAYFIEGDLNNPTVVALPGVTPTYGLKCRAAQTPVGFVYASNNHGLWAWQGGSVSTKISEQLEDNFFLQNDLLGDGQGVFFGPTVDICSWGDWIVTTNDWLYDTVTGGWWQLPPGTAPDGIHSPPHLWYQTSYEGSLLYAAPAVPTADSVVDIYQITQPTSTYTWTSYPIRSPQGSKNKALTMREVVVRAQGAGTVEVVFTGIGGSTSGANSSPSETLTFATTAQPSLQRITTGLTAEDVTVTVTSTASVANQPAPILYSLAIGYVELPQPVTAT